MRPQRFRTCPVETFHFLVSPDSVWEIPSSSRTTWSCARWTMKAAVLMAALTGSPNKRYGCIPLYLYRNTQVWLLKLAGNFEFEKSRTNSSLQGGITIILITKLITNWNGLRKVNIWVFFIQKKHCSPIDFDLFFRPVDVSQKEVEAVYLLMSISMIRFRIRYWDRCQAFISERIGPKQVWLVEWWVSRQCPEGGCWETPVCVKGPFIVAIKSQLYV